MDNIDFFQKQTPFDNAKKRYGIWPTTVWPISYSDKEEQELKRIIGDGNIETGSEKDDKFTRGKSIKLGYKNLGRKDGRKTEVSIFSPQIAQYILNMYAPKEGVCFDPFGGGGTRSIMSAKHGLNYIGYELREEEVQSVLKRVKNNKVDDKVSIIQGSSTSCNLVQDNTADFALTCPPYWSMEVYSDLGDDLSNKSYAEFLLMMEEVIKEEYRILKPGSVACWVVGLHRDKANNNELVHIPNDIARIHSKVGFTWKDEVILHQQNNGAIQRVGNFEKGNRLLVRTHEYLEVFQKK